MRNLFLLTLFSVLIPYSASAQSAAIADGLRKEYNSKMDIWTLSVQAATTRESQEMLRSERPDGDEYAKKIWTALRGSLEQEGSLETGSWLLKLVRSLPGEDVLPETQALRSEIVQQITNVVEKQHVRSPRLASMCMGLVAIGDMRSLKLLERIEKENPDRAVQGVAALGIAMLLQNLSDDVTTMKRRLSLIRKAIIESAHVEIDGVTIAKLADDQLYVIRYLTKGREAPDLKGVDVSGATFALSELKGKVVILLFWNSAVDDFERFLEMHQKLTKKMEGKSFALIGVTNDSTATMRLLQANGSLPWRNFCDANGELAKLYRVQNRPIAYVLDQNRVIQYMGNPGSFAELTADALLLNP
jgi:peroxiredoxin